MSTEVYESALIAAPIDKVWAAVRPLDFKFWDLVKSAELEGKADASEVGGVRRVTYKDGAVQSLKLTELSDAKTTVSWELVGGESKVLSAVHTVRLFRVTTHDQTMIEWVSDFSKDADAPFIADAKWKKVEFFKSLTKALVKRRKNWMPLEGNPGLMGKYCKQLGVNMTGIVEFQDVLSLEPDALSWVSAPQLALLLMFPINAAAEQHRKSEEKLIETKGHRLAQCLSPPSNGRQRLRHGRHHPRRGQQRKNSAVRERQVFPKVPGRHGQNGLKRSRRRPGSQHRHRSGPSIHGQGPRCQVQCQQQIQR